MKAKKLFISLLLLLLLLIGLCVWIIFQEQTERFIVQKNFAFGKALSKPIERNITEAQEDIRLLLEHAPICFEHNTTIKEQNLTQTGRESIEMLLAILNRLDQEVALGIWVHSHQQGARRFHRMETQHEADILALDLRNHDRVRYISALGYGEEFYSRFKEINSSCDYLEITLHQITAEDRRFLEGNRSVTPFKSEKEQGY